MWKNPETVVRNKRGTGLQQVYFRDLLQSCPSFVFPTVSGIFRNKRYRFKQDGRYVVKIPQASKQRGETERRVGCNRIRANTDVDEFNTKGHAIKVIRVDN